MGGAAGRPFAGGGGGPGSPGVVVLGRRYWLRRFNGGADAIGASLTLNGAPHTVVGALGVDLPPPFDNVDVWSPRVDDLSGFTPAGIAGGPGYLTGVGGLAPAVPVGGGRAGVGSSWDPPARGR